MFVTYDKVNGGNFWRREAQDKHLFRYRPRSEKIHWTCIACPGALTISIVAGSFNSSFTNEFAWLSMMLMGISVGRLNKDIVGELSDLG